MAYNLDDPIHIQKKVFCFLKTSFAVASTTEVLDTEGRHFNLLHNTEVYHHLHVCSVFHKLSGLCEVSSVVTVVFWNSLDSTDRIGHTGNAR